MEQHISDFCCKFKIANERNFKESKYIEWTTPLPIEHPMHSPKFSYMNYECFLDLFSYNTAGGRGAKPNMVVLDMVTSKPHHEEYPFYIWVTVCIITKNDVRVENWTTILDTCEIWRRPLPAIEMYLNNSLLTLGITIEFPYKDYQELNCMQTLSEDFGHLFDDKVYSDVQVKCEDKIWNAHKNILSVRCKTLVDMVQSNKKEGQSCVIEIQDTDAKTVEAFLKYLYTGTLAKLATEDIKKLYAAAHKYAVCSLKIKCAALLMYDMKPENACEILALSNQFTDMDLKENVIDYIVEKKIPLDNDVWENFCKSFPVLATEVLNVFCKHQFSK